MFSYSNYVIYDFFSLKGQCHEIFDPRFFWLNCTPGSADSWAKTVLHTVPKEMKDSEIKHEMYLGLSPIWRKVFVVKFLDRSLKLFAIFLDS
jgi:hypothetical protein